MNYRNVFQIYENLENCMTNRVSLAALKKGKIYRKAFIALAYMTVRIFPLHRLFLQVFLQHEIRLRYSVFPQPVFEQDIN